MEINPPYNLSKQYNSHRFKAADLTSYTHWFQTYLVHLDAILNPTASVYICSDWRSSSAIFDAIQN